MKHRIIAILLLVVVIGVIAVPAAAAMIENDLIMPCYNNTASTSTNFSISTAGKATVTAVYNGHKGITTGATVTSYIEKRTLGIFWTKVDIGEPNNEWVDTSTDYAEAFVHEFWLEDKGTYRATVVYEISGTGGATDVIDFDKTVTYS